MRNMFKPTVIGRLPVKNRLVRSATYENPLDEKQGFVESLAPVYEALADLVHHRGGRLVAQINHCGLKAFKSGPDGQHWAPSDGVTGDGQPARQMDAEAIARLVRDFASTAARCQEAGLDASRYTRPTAIC